MRASQSNTEIARGLGIALDQRKVAAALKPIYRAANAEQAMTELAAFEAVWGGRYPIIIRACSNSAIAPR